MSSQDFGKYAESLVVKLLQKENYSILEQNYKKFFGEIDIIAQKEELIVFVEVKARKKPKSSMFELVSYIKQQKIMRVAQEYIVQKQFCDKIFRFDVVLIESNYQNEEKISYIENAFYEKE